MSTYHTTVRDVYKKAAETPESALCCIPQSPLYLPELTIPQIMHEMNYGCGSTVHPDDMSAGQRVLYVGVGGGLEALQLAYFTRRPGGVIAIDPVKEMREVAKKNLEEAARLNPWFDPSFVTICDGDALDLPVEAESIDFAAQNCLFNIFTTADDGDDLARALNEMHRVMKPAGRLAMSDPVAPYQLPLALREDARLRAACLSGCPTLEHYLGEITAAGFGTVMVRSRRPYRLLDCQRYPLDQDVLLETVEVTAIKTPAAEDGPCIFTGQTAIYSGQNDSFDDGAGHVLPAGMPMPVCDKTAMALRKMALKDLTVTPPTWHDSGGGCC